MRVSEAQHIAACQIAAQVYHCELKPAEAARLLAENHGLNINSARDFIDDYRHLARGEVFQRAMSGAAMKHFMEQVALIERPSGRANAIKALNAHIQYYEQDGGRTQMMRSVLAEFEAEGAPPMRPPALDLVDSYEEAEANAARFLEVSNLQGSHTFAVLSSFSHWHYFPSLNCFAPSKFIGYRATTAQGYAGAGTGTATRRRLNNWFQEVERGSPTFHALRERLEAFLAGLGRPLSKKTIEGSGAIYVPKGAFLEDDVPQAGPENSYWEGAVVRVTVNAYERDPAARAKCIQHYGCKCSACEMTFPARYGIGEGFIHVHHLVELSTIGREYKVDPIGDLRPLCPNCHAMVHTRKPAMSIDELKELLRGQQ